MDSMQGDLGRVNSPHQMNGDVKKKEVLEKARQKKSPTALEGPDNEGRNG